MSTGEESDQVAQRRANLDELKKLGVDPYPHRFDTQATIISVVVVVSLVGITIEIGRRSHRLRGPLYP